jgi:3',5'-cyclic AMP phosphodiesterase CpdA
MRLVHLSDLHFGSEDAAAVEALKVDLATLDAHAILVSGDLTQRALSSEFAAARSFLGELPAPAMAVAGNHDVPLLPAHERFLDPYRRYRRKIANELQPRLSTDGLVALGLNTARGNTRKSGRLNRRQMATVERVFSTAPPGAVRVLVSHHPFIPPPDRPDASIVGRAPLALEAVDRAGVDLVLSGHRHVGHARVLPVGTAASSTSALHLLAGTACSRRQRGEPNSFNVVEGNQNELRVTVREWDGVAFAPRGLSRWIRDGGAWTPDA